MQGVEPCPQGLPPRFLGIVWSEPGLPAAPPRGPVNPACPCRDSPIHYPSLWPSAQQAWAEPGVLGRSQDPPVILPPNGEPL